MRAEAAERRKQSWMLYLGGAEPYERFTFDSYDPDLNDTHKLLKACREFNPKTHNLLVIGPVGVGKTHLTTAIDRSILESGGKARVFDKVGLWEFYKEHGIDALVALDGLTINDVENKPNTDTVVEFLARLLDKRAAWKKPGVKITTNKMIEDLHQILGSKTADRLDGMFQIFVVPPETKSVRGLLKRKRKNEA